MNGQARDRADQVAKVFAENQTQPFPVLAKALREQLAVSAKDLSMRLGKHRSYINMVEAGRYLMLENDLKSYAKILSLNDGFAEQFRQKWLANYETGIKKVFAGHPGDPFPALFRAIRKTVGIATNKLSRLLGKHDSHISQMEEKNAYFPESNALATMSIFCLQAELAEEFMASWKKHYQNWTKREKKKTAAAEAPLPEAVTDDQKARAAILDKLEDFFLDYGNEPSFPIFFKKLRELLGIAAIALTTALGQEKGFINQFERSTIFLPEDLAKKCAEIFNLGERLTIEFLDKWEEYAGKYRQPKVLVPNDSNAQADIPEALPEKTVSVEEIMNSPLVRFAQHLCLKAGIDLGLPYLQRNDEIKIHNLGPKADNCTRLMEICALVKKLKLGPNQIHELATVLFANYPGKYRLVIEGGGMDFLDLFISLATKGADISIYKDEDED